MIIKDLRNPSDKTNQDFLLDEEEDVAGDLGIYFNKIRNGKGDVEEITLTQTGLIKRILVATGLEDCSKLVHHLK